MFATVRRVTATGDDLGDSTSAEVELVVPVIGFAPDRILERGGAGAVGADSRSAPVTIPAKFYLAVPIDLNSDDEIVWDGKTWRVLGGSSVWGEQTEVPVERTDAV